MGKKEWAREVEKIHQRILELLRRYEGASIFQEPYHGFFFNVFRDAYERGFCGPLRYNCFVDTGGIEWIRRKPEVSGDSIWHYAKEQGWVSAEMTGEERRYRTTEVVKTWWDAWSYAFHKLGHKEKRQGWKEKDPLGKGLNSPTGGISH